MPVDFLREVFERHATEEAIVWRDRGHTYGYLLEAMQRWGRLLDERGVERGSVVVVEADFSPNAVALLLALAERASVIVPLTSSAAARKNEFLDVAQAEYEIRLDGDDREHLTRRDVTADHPLYGKLRGQDHPGLVLFSSGSTGKAKAAVHDFVPLLEKFHVPRQRLRTLTFLLFDHIGGINTLLYTLSNGGCLVTPEDRSPDGVLAAIDRHRVDLLPTSPTFLNLVLLSGAFRDHDLSSLRIVTYGTEPMPQSTLDRFHALFPEVRLQQTYGLSELGILRSKSKASNSLWVKVGGEGVALRVVDGLLQIQCRSAMLGYLNAPSPFTDDGWFETGDMVETDGDFMRFLGRASEMINVGGEKVFPAEVESVIQQMDNVAEASVSGEANPITGQIVTARVSLVRAEESKAFRARLKKHCASRMQAYKVPVKIAIVEHALHTERFKKTRSCGVS